MNKIHNFMHRLNNPDLARLFIRLALAAVFINAGWLKLTNMEAVIAAFGSMGISASLSVFVSYVEFLGGIAFGLGIFVRYFGVMIAVDMIVAIIKVHYVHGFSIAKGGYEFVLVLLLCSLAMVTMGAGKYSLAELFKKKM